MIAAALTLLAMSSPAAAIVCPASCEGRWTDSVLFVGSSEVYGDDAGFLFNLASWRNFSAPSEFADLPPAIMASPVVAHSPRDFHEALATAAADCKRIKYLSIGSHGSPGAIYLGDENRIATHTIERDLEGLDCVMAEGARIELMGCNVGRGCRGDQFLALMAKTLLPKGGAVQANTFYSSTPIPGVIPHFSLNFDTQTLYVKPPGPEPDPGRGQHGWDNAVTSGRACAAELRECRMDMARMRTRVRGCRIDDWILQLLGSTDGNLANLIEEYEGPNVADGPAIGFIADPRTAERSRNTFTHLTNCAWACKEFRSTGPCDVDEEDVHHPAAKRAL